MGVSLAPEDLGGDIQCIPISALKASTLELRYVTLILNLSSNHICHEYIRPLIFQHNYRSQTKLWEGNVFTGVWSVHGGGGRGEGISRASGDRSHGSGGH